MLDIYLYKCARPRFDAMVRYERDAKFAEARWHDRLEDIPRNRFGDLDPSLFTDEDRKVLDGYNRDLLTLRSTYNYVGNRSLDAVKRWRDFMALHYFVRKRFYGERRDDIPVLLGGRVAMFELHEAFVTTHRQMCEGVSPMDLNTPPQTDVSSPFTQGEKFYDWFNNKVCEAIEFFWKMYVTLNEEIDEVVYYQAHYDT